MSRRYRTMEEKKKKSSWWGEGRRVDSVPQESGSVIGGSRPGLGLTVLLKAVKGFIYSNSVQRPLNERYNGSVELQWHREIVWWSRDAI